MTLSSGTDHAVAKGWIALFEELDRWHREGRQAEFWWRDDDAQRPSPALDRLIELSALHRVPMMLAVIPQGAEAGLAACADKAPVSVAQHGIAHRDNAPQGTKKTELHDRMLADPSFPAALHAGREKLSALFAAAFLPVMVPPWNRIGPEIAGHLSDWGYTGLSADGPPRPAAGDLRQANTHVDLIDWRAGKRFVGPDRALSAITGHLADRRLGKSPQGAVGILTHHLDHDRPLWAFLGQLLGLLGGHPAAVWADPKELFSAQ